MFDFRKTEKNQQTPFFGGRCVKNRKLPKKQKKGVVVPQTLCRKIPTLFRETAKRGNVTDVLSTASFEKDQMTRFETLERPRKKGRNWIE
jgi:hypothetical protein